MSRAGMVAAYVLLATAAAYVADTGMPGHDGLWLLAYFAGVLVCTTVFLILAERSLDAGSDDPGMELAKGDK